MVKCSYLPPVAACGLDPSDQGSKLFLENPVLRSTRKITFHGVNYDGLSLQIRQLSSWKVKEVALGKRPAFFGKKGNFFHCKLFPLVFVVCLFCLCSIRHATKICFVKVLSHFFFQTSFLRALYCFSFLHSQNVLRGEPSGFSLQHAMESNEKENLILRHVFAEKNPAFQERQLCVCNGLVLFFRKNDL